MANPDAMFCSPQRPSPPCGSGARTRGPHRRHHRHMPAERLGIGFHTARGATVAVDLRRDGSAERRLSDGADVGRPSENCDQLSPRRRCRISRFAPFRRRRWLRTFAPKKSTLPALDPVNRRAVILAESDRSVTKPDAETNLLSAAPCFGWCRSKVLARCLWGGLPAGTAPGDERPNLSDLLEKTIGCEPCQVSAQPSLKGLASLAKRRW